MEQETIDLKAPIDAIARYLGETFPTLSINRYDDPARDVVGFRFIGEAHGNVEFSREYLAQFAHEPAAIARELHLRHACAAITATAPGQRVVFTSSELRHEPAAGT
jgi:hypothetical protein